MNFGKNETYFKSKIRMINDSLYSIAGEEMIYRVINFGNIYFFAQEISTGCIFPTYCFSTDNGNNKNMNFKNFSYLKSGKYFLYFTLKRSDNMFEYIFDDNGIKTGAFEIPTKKEIKLYLKEKKNNRAWIETLLELESRNLYMCDIIEIKEKIKLLECSSDSLDIDFGKVETIYVRNNPNIDLEAIKEFGYDLSIQSNLCNLIGREEEKKRITKAITISGDSVILIGEPGSGKTSIPESLALDIRNGTNPWLNNKTIFYLDTASLVCGTKYRGDFEERLLKFIHFCEEHQETIILFIDEIHTLYGLGRTSDSSIDAMNILKPYITKGILTIIGTTTRVEYDKYMKNDPAFLRRFEEINVSSPDRNMNIEIILSYIKELQEKYSVILDIDNSILRDVVEFIVDISEPKNQRAIGINKVINPTISKNIIKDAFTEAVYNNQKNVTLDDICLAILSCDKFPPTYRKTVAEKLKKKIMGIAESAPREIIKFENKKLTLIK